MTVFPNPNPVPDPQPGEPPLPTPPPSPSPGPVREPEPDKLPDEIPLPNPDEGDPLPQHVWNPGSVPVSSKNLDQLSQQRKEDYLRRASITYLECSISLMLTHLSKEEVAEILEQEACFIRDFD